jgi:hypothetical protein
MGKRGCPNAEAQQLLRLGSERCAPSRLSRNQKMQLAELKLPTLSCRRLRGFGAKHWLELALFGALCQAWHFCDPKYAIWNSQLHSTVDIEMLVLTVQQLGDMPMSFAKLIPSETGATLKSCNALPIGLGHGLKEARHLTGHVLADIHRQPAQLACGSQWCCALRDEH